MVLLLPNPPEEEPKGAAAVVDVVGVEDAPKTPVLDVGDPLGLWRVLLLFPKEKPFVVLLLLLLGVPLLAKPPKDAMRKKAVGNWKSLL